MSDEPSSWTDLINESVHTSYDQDIGDIEAVSRNLIVVKKGLVNVRRYYIPLHRFEGWDGKVVWLNIPEDAVKANYERDAAPEEDSLLLSRRFSGNKKWFFFMRSRRDFGHIDFPL